MRLPHDGTDMKQGAGAWCAVRVPMRRMGHA
jgi:hypothetical protein